MTEFTFLFRGRPGFTSADEAQKTTQKWVAWFKEMGAAGVIKDPGHPLQATGAVVKGKDKAVNDGPFAEAKDVVGGYSLIAAKDLAHAVELAKGCPILETGGSVEVREVQQITM